jgi:hypothetical protein
MTATSIVLISSVKVCDTALQNGQASAADAKARIDPTANMAGSILRSISLTPWLATILHRFAWLARRAAGGTMSIVRLEVA